MTWYYFSGMATMLWDVIVRRRRRCRWAHAPVIHAARLVDHLTIGSCFSVHYRVMEHVGSLESTEEA